MVNTYFDPFFWILVVFYFIEPNLAWWFLGFYLIVSGFKWLNRGYVYFGIQGHSPNYIARGGLATFISSLFVALGAIIILNMLDV